MIGWHILLPAFTVGLGSFIAVLEGLRLATGRDVYARISVFWIKIFSIAFGMGVVTGVVRPFQLGTNWSRYADATAKVLSPLFAYEDLTAFFLEAAFLGVLLFGRKLVPPWTYFASALMVALGTLGLAEKLTNQARAKNAGIESRMRWARRVHGKLSWAGDRHRRYPDALAARSGAS